MHTGTLGKLMTGLAFVLTLGVPVAVWWVSVANPGAYLAHTLPPGQSLYILAKLAGLIALCVFWLQCLLGLAPRTPVLRGLPKIGIKAHKRLGLLAAGLILTHAGLFVVAASLRTDSPAWNLLWPDFTHGYYNSFVSIGLIAVWLLILGVYAGWRTARGERRWKKVHMVWVAVFALAFVHALTIGSESRFGVMRYLMLFIGTSLVAAAVSRTRSAWKRSGRWRSGARRNPVSSGR